MSLLESAETTTLVKIESNLIAAIADEGPDATLADFLGAVTKELRRRRGEHADDAG